MTVVVVVVVMMAMVRRVTTSRRTAIAMPMITTIITMAAEAAVVLVIILPSLGCGESKRAREGGQKVAAGHVSVNILGKAWTRLASIHLRFLALVRRPQRSLPNNL